MVRIKKKIGVIAEFFWPVSGNKQDYPLNIANALKKNNFDFKVLTTDTYLDGKKINRPNPDEYNKIPIKRLKTYGHIGTFSKIWFPNVKEFDIIHITGGYRHMQFFWTFLTKKRDAKVILSPFYPMHPRKNIFIKFMISLIDKTIGKWLLQKCDLVLAETELEKKWLQSLGVKNIEIIPYSIPDSYFKRYSKSEFKKKHRITGKMVLWLGGFSPIKNLPELISIIPQINATFVFAGHKNEYSERCENIADKLGIKNKTIWLDFLDEEEKLKALSACDVYVLPSMRESLGTTIIEAMAQGKPVIASNTGGLPEVVPDKYCLYSLGDKQELAEKVQELLTNKQRITKIEKLGRAKAKKFAWASVSKRYIKYLIEHGNP